MSGQPLSLNVVSPYRRNQPSPFASRVLLREIARTAARGPRPDEVALFKRQAAAAKRSAEIAAAYAELGAS